MGLGAATIVGKEHIGRPFTRTSDPLHLPPSPGRALDTQLKADGYIVPKPNSNLAAPILAGQPRRSFLDGVRRRRCVRDDSGRRRRPHHRRIVCVRTRHMVQSRTKRHGDETEHLSSHAAPRWSSERSRWTLGRAARIQRRVSRRARLRGRSERQRPGRFSSRFSWRRFSRTGAIAGMLGGLVSSLLLIAISPVLMGDRAIFPARQPRDRVDSDRFGSVRLSARCSRAIENPKRCSTSCRYAPPPESALKHRL